MTLKKNLHDISMTTLKSIKFYIVSGEYNSTQVQTHVFNSFC